ncbi:MAG: hypothetical protein ACLQRH_12405 [Acidimicrobiales bacterium]
MASITCPNCQTVLDAGTANCPSCGSPQSGVAPAAAAGPVGPPPTPAPAAKPQAKFDVASINHVDRLVGIGTIVLFISLFLPWYSFKFGGIVGTVTWDGLTAHGYLYITLFLSLGVIALLAAEATGVWKVPATSPMERDQMLLIATTINFVLVLIAFVFKPGGYSFSGVGWSFGSFVALAASIVAAFPLGWPVIQARRAKK